MKVTLFALLQSLPAYYSDAAVEPPEARAERLEIVAEAAWSAAEYATCTGDWQGADWCKVVWPGRADELGVMLVTIGWWESKFALHVHQGRCRLKIGECDAVKLPDGRWIALARSPWQLQRTHLAAPHWHKMVGTQLMPTFEAAYAAAKVLGSSRARCGRRGDWVEPTISGYAGTMCSWRSAPARARTYRRLIEEFRAEKQEKVT